MAKKKHEEEHENHERWLVSYADFMTLLMAFFVVMYSVSKVDNKRLSQAAESIKWAMHFGGNGGVGQMPIFDGPLSEGGNVMGMAGGAVTAEDITGLENLKQKIAEAVEAFVLQAHGSQSAVTVAIEDQHVVVRLAAADFFDPGQAVLRPQIVPVLDAIAGEIVPLKRPMRIEGHTDDTPVTGTRYRDNWELSAARAATVASYLERAHHAAPGLLSATGFADTRPIAEGDTADARELNRRIEIVVELALQQPAKSKKPGAKKLPFQ
ncbi:MAG TPA: flagellar motor protein MotB [Anaeromyxobacteraceae bacterium]|nr:flagellar motor protein MotB [Anaeromyxobacteraceae bacterium]